MRLLKFLDSKGRGPYSGYQWPLPAQNGDGSWRPGEWVRAEGALIVCENGIHACTPEQPAEWLNARCFALEYRDDDYSVVDGKVLGREARLLREYTGWNESNQRLFAIDCAEHVLPLFEREWPEDRRVRDCIETARRHAAGEATHEELAAARAAAWDAAAATPGATARAAASAAAGAAVWAAVWATARAAASGAARAAARAAGWNAARAAGWNAGWAVRWDVARAVAAAEERQWQSQRLMIYLEERRGDD